MFKSNSCIIIVDVDLSILHLQIPFLESLSHSWMSMNFHSQLSQIFEMVAKSLFHLISKSLSMDLLLYSNNLVSMILLTNICNHNPLSSIHYSLPRLIFDNTIHCHWYLKLMLKIPLMPLWSCYTDMADSSMLLQQFQTAHLQVVWKEHLFRREVHAPLLVGWALLRTQRLLCVQQDRFHRYGCVSRVLPLVSISMIRFVFVFRVFMSLSYPLWKMASPLLLFWHLNVDSPWTIGDRPGSKFLWVLALNL